MSEATVKRDPPRLNPSSAKEILEGDADEFEPAAIDNLDEYPPFVRASVECASDVRSRLGKLHPNRNFDACVSVALHKSINLTLFEASDAGFWRWFAVTHARDLVKHRHGEDAGQANYGVGSLWYNLFARLWFRAELSIDPNEDDPYTLTRRGGSDFWASGVLRHRYSSARNLVRAMIRYQFTNPCAPNRGTLVTDDVRELYKRLRRIHATVAFELLSPDDCQTLLCELAKDLK